MTPQDVEWVTTHGDSVEVYGTEIGNGTLQHPLEWGFRYRVRARNGRIVEVGSEGYTRRHAAVKAALRHHPRLNFRQKESPK